MTKSHIVICGAGMSGLYIAHLLTQIQNPPRITIIEASNRIGGRVKSYKEGNIAYEIGAGRFSTKHRLVCDLIKHCGLSKNILPITKGHSYYIDKTHIKDDKALLKYYKVNRTLPQLWEHIADNYLSWSGIGRLSLPYILSRELSKPTAEALMKIIGYQDIVRMNSRLILETLLDSYDIRNEYQFNVLYGGLEQIPKCLFKELRDNGVKFRLNSPVKDIKPVGNKVFVVLDDDIIECDACFVAITKNVMNSLPYITKHMSDALDMIMSVPLMRIYATFDERWFSNMNPIVTDLPIEYVIPINPDKGVIMISYVDYKNVDYMRRHIKRGDLQETIMKQIREIMGRPIPEPTSLEYYDWTEGIHGYRPGAIYSHIQDNIETLAKQNIYVAGEMVSKTAQGWIEGALQTAIEAVQRFKGQSGGTNISIEDVKKNKWIAIRGLVFDVSGFISQHPGGANIYKGIGRDHTARWNASHSNTIFNSHLATEEVRKKYGIRLIGNLLK